MEINVQSIMKDVSLFSLETDYMGGDGDYSSMGDTPSEKKLPARPKDDDDTYYDLLWHSTGGSELDPDFYEGHLSTSSPSVIPVATPTATPAPASHVAAPAVTDEAASLSFTVDYQDDLSSPEDYAQEFKIAVEVHISPSPATPISLSPAPSPATPVSPSPAPPLLPVTLSPPSTAISPVSVESEPLPGHSRLRDRKRQKRRPGGNNLRMGDEHGSKLHRRGGDVSREFETPHADGPRVDTGAEQGSDSSRDIGAAGQRQQGGSESVSSSLELDPAGPSTSVAESVLGGPGTEFEATWRIRGKDVW